MEERILEIPTLGRRLQLGSLYDCRDDTFIPGLTLWDPDEQNKHRDVNIQRYSELEILETDNIRAKASSLKVDNSLKASLLAGLVNVTGSARFLYDERKSNSQCRQTIHYKATTRLERLTMKELGVHNVQTPDVFEEGTATHVVTSVLYGAQAFFVFDRFQKQDENKTCVKTEMHEALKIILQSHDKGTEHETEHVHDNMECTVYSDFGVESSPTTYMEAISTFSRLASIPEDKAAIPQVVLLYPLSKLDSRAVKIKRDIDVSLVAQIEEVIENVGKCQISCDDLASNIICRDFPNYAKKLDLFKELMLKFKISFEEKLAQILPQLRGGKVGEIALKDLLSQLQSSPYNYQQLDVYLKCMEKELNIIETNMKSLSSVNIIGSQKILDKLLEDPSLENVVCFSFGFDGEEDEYLNDMETYLRVPTTKEFNVKQRWFHDKSMMRKTRTSVKQFIDFAKANQGSKATIFRVMDFGESDAKSTKVFTIFLYKEGELVSKEFTPPGTPGKPEIVETSDESVSLKWDPPTAGLSSVQHYVLKYRDTSAEDKKWVELKTNSAESQAIIPGLKPNIKYECCVAAACSVGVSEQSTTSEICKTGLESIHREPIDKTLPKPAKIRKLMDDKPVAHCTEVAKFNWETDLNLVRETKMIKERLDEYQVRCDKLRSNTICRDFPTIEEKLSSFKEMTTNFKELFQRKLSQITPPVSDGTVEEHTLRNLLSEIEQSPFHFQYVKDWMNYMENEMTIMKKQIEEFGTITKIGSQNILYEMLGNPSFEYIICFSFGFPGRDEYLNDMATYLRKPEPGEYIVRKRFPDTNVSRKTQTLASQFSAFAGANQGSEGKLFAVMAFDDCVKGSVQGGSVSLYKDGILKTSEFLPPGTPGKPKVLEIYDESITVKWDQPKTGLPFVENYLVKYRDTSSKENKWFQFNTGDTATEATIRDLKPNTSYECCVAAVCSVGVSKQSATSDPVSTIDIFPAPPTNVRATTVSEASVTIEWDRPAWKYKNSCTNGYKVKYETISCENTENENIVDIPPSTCNYTVDKLKENTTCRICVCAVYNNAGDSSYSEPIDIKTTKRKEKTIKRVGELLTAKSKTVKEGDTSKGEPTIFSVPLEKGYSRSQSKYHTYTFGDYVAEKRHLVIMVVGATGAGKSTLINGMVNYILDVKWNDPFRFQIVAEQGENKSAGQAQSQTQLITAYTIHYRDGLTIGCSLTIIDTPGFGDTRGIEKDRVIVDQIREFFSNSKDHQVDHIDAIGFVAQASQARLTHTQRYVFDSILAIFGKNVAQNIMLLITFADGQKPPVLDAIKAAEIPFGKKMFKFNNSALFASNSAKSDISFGCTTSGSPEDDHEENFDKMFWKMGTQSMRKFFKALEEAEPKSLTLTKEVLDERKRLEIVVEGLQPQIKMGCSKLEALRKEQQILEQHEREIEANKNFVYDVEVSKSRKIEIHGEYITNCSKCHFTCHYPCGIGDDRRKINCAAMKDKKCTVCPDKCQWDIHFNQAYKFEWYTEKEKKTYRELEEKYKDATGKKLSVKKVIEKHRGEFIAFQECVFGSIIESQRCLKRLDVIALRPNPLGATAYVDLLIESEKREAKAGYEGRIAALYNVRQDAEIMRCIQESNYCPWEDYKEHIPGILTREQYEMYRQRALEGDNYDHYGKYMEMQSKGQKKSWYKFWR